jgi:hypothetical protein
METKKYYEIVFDKFHKRWAFKPQGLPGALQVGKSKTEIMERAFPICRNHPCVLRILDEAGNVEEERVFKDSVIGS